MPDGVAQEFLPLWSATGLSGASLKEKAVVHREGLWHPTVQLWLRCQTAGKAHLLLQLRSPGKDSYPSCWDVSVAGHVQADENLERATLRELQEELGLQLGVPDLHFLFRMPYYGRYPNGQIDCEWQHVYLADLGKQNQDFRLQDGEVSALRWVNAAELRREWARLSRRHRIKSAAVRCEAGAAGEFGEYWQGHQVHGFALHRHYPSESNATRQMSPKEDLGENHYWAKLLGILGPELAAEPPH